MANPAGDHCQHRSPGSRARVRSRHYGLSNLFDLSAACRRERLANMQRDRDDADRARLDSIPDKHEPAPQQHP